MSISHIDIHVDIRSYLVTLIWGSHKPQALPTDAREVGHVGEADKAGTDVPAEIMERHGGVMQVKPSRNSS